MPTRVEEICKRIHILFAKGEAYQNSPDLVILSKVEMFTLLEELNEAMYEVLDQYEATTRAKERARIETEREASEIIAKAKISAEDIQAATLSYTDTMMDELSAAMEQTTKSIKEQYLGFLAQIDDKQAALKENRDQIKNQLAELHDRDTYLKLLNEIREEAAEVRAEEEAEAKAEEEAKKAEKKREVVEKKDDTKKKEKTVSEDEFPEPPKPPAPVIRVNRPGENPGVTFTTRPSHNKAKKSAPVISKQVNTMSEEDYNRLSPEEREALEKSTPAYGHGFTADDFDLDAEYEQFKLEEEAKNNANEDSKKGGFKLFGKKKK